MNIVQLQDLLKGLPDNRLKQEMDQPTGTVPQYLVLSEIVRRDKMRTTGMAQSPTTTVVQDVMNQRPGPQAMPPEEMPQEQAPQGYASGGFISAADAMGGAGVRGFAPPAPKQPMMFGQNQPGQGMFTPNTAPKAPAPMTNNNFNLSQPQPQFDGGQVNDMNSPSFYQQGAYADGGAIRYDLGGKITSVESSNDPRAKNPRSTATGAGQFIESTWLSVLEKMKPGLIKKIGREAALNLRYDPVLSKQATEVYAAENRDMLTRRGFEPTEGNIYLAHFAGPGGASALLSADPSASAGEILGEKVVKANPFLKNMSVADIKDWAAKKMSSQPSGGATATNTSGKPGEGAMALAEIAGGTGSNTGGIASLPDGKTDRLMPELAELGEALAKGGEEAPPLEIPDMAPGSAELAAGTRTISPEDQLAQYASLRRGYMANGGAVRMQDGPPNGDAVRGLPSWATESILPENFFDAPDFTKMPTFENPSGVPALDSGTEAEGAEAPIDPSISTPMDRSWKPPEQFMGPRAGIFDQPPEPTAEDKFIEYMKERDTKLAALYDEELRKEEERRAQATGFPAFLRQLGLGMLSNNRSMGESLQAGLAGAIGSREEQDAEARDRIRALQLKKEMGGIEGLGDIAELKYKSELARQAAEAENILRPRDYLTIIDDMQKAVSDAYKSAEDRMVDNPDQDPAVLAAKANLANVLSKTGMGGTIAGVGQFNWTPDGIVPTQ